MPDVFVSNDSTPATPKQASSPSPVSPRLKKTPKGLMNPLASFRENPEGISFQSQGSDEVILLFARQHFIVNIGWILITVLLLLIPPLFGFLIDAFDQTFVVLPVSFVILSILLYFLVVFGYAFSNFITWYYNVLLVTQKEIVDIDYSHLVYHDVAATRVNLVEDVSYIQSGFLRGIFNYGDVYIQTAGGKENIEGHRIPKPATAARIILSLIGKGVHIG